MENIIDDLIRKLKHEEDVAITKSFVENIAMLLQKEKMHVIVDKYDMNELEENDNSTYKYNLKYGVRVSKINCEEHDSDLEKKVLDEFIELSQINIRESHIWNMIVESDRNEANDLADEIVDYFSEILIKTGEQLKELYGINR